MSTEPGIIIPDWPAPAMVRAISTTRRGGFSQGPYNSLNLALHVEDDAAQVASNRQHLKTHASLPAEPLWLEQVHGDRVVDASQCSTSTPACDASFSDQPGVVCAVMTADCLPVLICDRQGERVAAAHAGWRGLAAGVIESSVGALQRPPQDLLVWLGPAIGPKAFEVGDEVRTAFVSDMPGAASAFRETRAGHYLADLYQLARLRLLRLGIEAVYGGGYCTFTDADQFFSFRRDGKTGRQASLIWLEKT